MIRNAKLSDAKAIKDILDFYARKRMLLKRSVDDIAAQTREFLVFENNGNVVGCVALHLYWPDMGEVRSFAVKQQHIGKGFGKMLLKHALNDAKKLGLKSVFTLTYKPEVFEKTGFKKSGKSLLPSKVWRDCLTCSKQENCDEILLEIKIA